MGRTAGIIFCVFCIFLSACGTAAEKESTVSGVIQHLEDGRLTVNGETVVPDPEGRFRYTLRHTKPAHVKLDYGKTFSLFLHPGDGLKLEIDAGNDIETVEISGDRLEINRFLIEDSHASAQAGAYFNTNFRELVGLEAEEFVERIDEIWRPFVQRFEAFLGRGPADPVFVKFHRAAMEYSRADILLRYPEWHRQVTGAWEFEPEDRFFDFLDDLDLNDPELLGIDEYTSFLDRYLAVLTSSVFEDPTLFEGQNYRPVRAKMRVCLDIFTDPEVRSEMLHSFMPLFLTESYHKGIDDLISTFRENCKDPAYVQEVDEIIAADREVRDGCKVVTYKTVEDVSLDAFVYLPEGHRVGDRRPAVAFFHGGGWDVGKPEWGRMQCEHFASLGMVAVSFEYRLYTQHDATPVQGIADAKSALRWMRSNAGELGIDTDRIAASGFSAGGHLALCAAMLDTFDEPGEDLTVSAKPNAFLLWVTPAKIFESNWFKRILKGQAEVADCDPFLHVRPGLPPAVMFQGTIDSDVPPWTARAFAQKMRDAGNRCDLHMYEGQTHLNWGDNAFDVLEEMDAFLESIGFMRP